MRQSLLFALTLLCAACGPDAFQVAGLPPPGVQKLDRNIALEGYLTSAGADCVERNLKPGARISIALDDGDADALIRVARHLESVGAHTFQFFCLGRCDDVLLVGSDAVGLMNFFVSDGISSDPTIAALSQMNRYVRASVDRDLVYSE